MEGRILVRGIALVLLGWVAMAFAPGNMALAGNMQAGYQVMQNENYSHPAGTAWDQGNIHYVDWYQGQEGKWHRGPHDKWQWRGKGGDEWYWGQRGHWYKEQNGWQFSSAGLVCNNNGRNCRYGGYLPPNGQGMVSRSNPNLYWQCDSNGNHCHWARRPR